MNATGKRKTAIANFRESNTVKGLIINQKKFEEYFKEERLRLRVLAPLSGDISELNGVVKVHGGGLVAQAEAIRHGISRYLKNKYFSNDDAATARIKDLKKNGFLTRDSRKKERKKPGQEGARRNFQSQKR